MKLWWPCSVKNGVPSPTVLLPSPGYCPPGPNTPHSAPQASQLGYRPEDPPLSHLQSSGPPSPPPVSLLLQSRHSVGPFGRNNSPRGCSLAGVCGMTELGPKHSRQRPGQAAAMFLSLLPPLSSLDQKSVPTHLPLARTSSSPAEEEKLTEILGELA